MASAVLAVWLAATLLACADGGADDKRQSAAVIEEPTLAGPAKPDFQPKSESKSVAEHKATEAFEEEVQDEDNTAAGDHVFGNAGAEHPPGGSETARPTSMVSPSAPPPVASPVEPSPEPEVLVVVDGYIDTGKLEAGRYNVRLDTAAAPRLDLPADGKEAWEAGAGKRDELVLEGAKQQPTAGLDDKDAARRGAMSKPKKGRASRKGLQNSGEFARSSDFEKDKRKLDSTEEASRQLTRNPYGKKAGPTDRLSQGLSRLGTSGHTSNRRSRPAEFLPRLAYFDSTYLGGNAAVEARQRRLDEDLADGPRPHRQAAMYQQPFDAPSDGGLAVTATLDRRSQSRPGTVYLQIGLRGSDRFGWRRPPLDVALVVDARVGAKPARAALLSLLRRLGPQDRLGLVVVGAGAAQATPLAPPRALRALLSTRLVELFGARSTSADLAEALAVAGGLLGESATAAGAVPGTQTALILTTGRSAPELQSVAQMAHSLTVAGVVTSVMELDASSEGAGWSVAANGHGNYHGVATSQVDAAVSEELASLARVVARLIRVNVRLAPGAHGVRVLGSRVLSAQEVTAVKQREVATDRNLSRTMGVAADRGEDDDGLQTVIPYFYGGDSHVILVELWVDDPGHIADVTVRYKDMVELKNASARVSVSMSRSPRDPTAAQLAVARNVRGLEVAQELQVASAGLARRDVNSVRQALGRAEAQMPANSGGDDAMLRGFRQLVDDGRWQHDAQRHRALVDALAVASRRKAGQPAR